VLVIPCEFTEIVGSGPRCRAMWPATSADDAPYKSNHDQTSGKGGLTSYGKSMPQRGMMLGLAWREGAMRCACMIGPADWLSRPT
jgi:hypothetical protein